MLADACTCALTLSNKKKKKKERTEGVQCHSADQNTGEKQYPKILEFLVVLTNKYEGHKRSGVWSNMPYKIYIYMYLSRRDNSKRERTNKYE